MATVKAKTRHHRKSEYPDKILRMAAKIFATRTYADASMDDIARAAKTTKSVVYYYFESKADILFALHAQGLDESLVQLNEVFASDETPLQRLRLALWVHTKTMCEDHWRRSFALRTAELWSLDRARKQLVEAKRRKYQSLIQRLFEEAAATGFIRNDLDLRVVSKIAIAGLNHIATWYREGGRLTASEIAALAVEYVLSGMAPKIGPTHAVDTGKAQLH